MKAAEAVAPQPQIGDVWARDMVVSHQARADLIAIANRNAAASLRDPAWRLVGRVVPVDHPGIEALRDFVDGRYSIGSVIDEHDALADLLALLASPGGPA